MNTKLRRMSKGNYGVIQEQEIAGTKIVLEEYVIPKGLASPRFVAYDVVAERDGQLIDLEPLGVLPAERNGGIGRRATESRYRLALEKLDAPEPNQALVVLREGGSL